jgi:3'-phosphoadenosine 5'-phosphosulfate sulfotransferase (PAPS reductase)/FAD synthetase
VGQVKRQPMFAHLTTAKRIRAAKAKTDRLVDHLLYLLKLHENNVIITYSGTLSSQITLAHAADAFNAFRRGLHQFEIVRLCALWDSPKVNKKKKEIPTEESIPTIIELIDLPEVIEALAKEIQRQWPEADDDEHAHEQAQRARVELRKAIADVRASKRFITSTRNLRNKHLAHSLSRTKHEKKTKRIPRMKYGYERKILLKSLPIVETLHRWINGKSFCFAKSQENARKNAEALWTRCTFNIQR